MPQQRTQTVSLVLLVAMIVGLAAVNYYWHSDHRAPVIIGHNAPLVAARQLRDMESYPVEHVTRLLRKNDLPGHYSIYNASAWLTLHVFGRNQLGVVYISTLYFLIYILAVYGTMRKLGNPKSALFAAFVAACLPGPLIASRTISANIAILAFTAVGVYLLTISDWLRKPVPVIVTAALAAISLRIGESISDTLQMLLAFAVVGGYVLAIRLFVCKSEQKRVLIILAGGTAVFLLLLNYDYLRTSLDYFRQEGVELSAEKYTDGDVWKNPSAFLAYPGLLIDQYLRPFFSLLTLAGLIALFREANRKTMFPVAYLLGSLLLASLIAKKQTYYLFFLVPAVPVIIAMAGEQIRNRAVRLALIAIVAIGGCWSFYRLTFVDKPLEPVAKIQRYRKMINFPMDFKMAPPVREMNLAKAAVALADRTEKATLLYLHDPAVNQPGSLFLYYLTLADWQRRISVLDPVFDMARLREEIANPKTERAFPAFILYIPFGESSLEDPKYFHTEFFADIMQNLDQYRLGNYRERAAMCVETLQSIDWERYRRREYPTAEFLLNGIGRFVLYDQPEAGFAVEVP